jgi:hypothetical protein
MQCCRSPSPIRVVTHPGPGCRFLGFAAPGAPAHLVRVSLRPISRMPCGSLCSRNARAAGPRLNEHDCRSPRSSEARESWFARRCLCSLAAGPSSPSRGSGPTQGGKPRLAGPEMASARYRGRPHDFTFPSVEDPCFPGELVRAIAGPGRPGGCAVPLQLCSLPPSSGCLHLR